MIHPSKLGRYEFIDDSKNSDKFYTIKFIKTDEYKIEYGKNGYSPQQTLIVDEKIAAKRIKEKIAKGYLHQDTDLENYHEKCWIEYRKEKLEIELNKKDDRPVRKIKI